MDLGQNRLLDDVGCGNAIISLGMHTLSDYVGCSMSSSPLKSIHDRRHRAWHVVIAHWQHTWLDDVGNGMLLSFIYTTHDRMTLGMACLHGPWEEHIVERCLAWHAIIPIRQEKRSNDIRLGIPYLPLYCTHGGTTSGVAWHHNSRKADTVG